MLPRSDSNVKLQALWLQQLSGPAITLVSTETMCTALEHAVMKLKGQLRFCCLPFCMILWETHPPVPSAALLNIETPISIQNCNLYSKNLNGETLAASENAYL